jgi:putative acetyltransferase
MIIRCYRDNDLEALVELFTASVHEVSAAVYDTVQRHAWARVPPDCAAWRERLVGRTILVAEIDTELAGFIAWEPDGHIDLLFTSPRHVRRGVASALYRSAEQASRAAGGNTLYTEASLVARHFFERHGFVVEEAQVVNRGGVDLQRFAMRKTWRTDACPPATGANGC